MFGKLRRTLAANANQKETRTVSYAFDHQWKQEWNRLARLEKGMDPGTIRHIEALGVTSGWRCLEIGAGGGSIAEWLCARVGSTGHVVATDLQTKFIEAIDAPNIEVRQHDITKDDMVTSGAAPPSTDA